MLIVRLGFESITQGLPLLHCEAIDCCGAAVVYESGLECVPGAVVGSSQSHAVLHFDPSVAIITEETIGQVVGAQPIIALVDVGCGKTGPKSRWITIGWYAIAVVIESIVAAGR